MIRPELFHPRCTADHRGTGLAGCPRLRRSAAIPAGLLVLALLTARTPAAAASITWTGKVSNNWQDTGNWDSGAAPGPSDTVAISAGVAINVPSGVTLSGLELGGATLQGGDITVTKLMSWTSGTVSSKLTVPQGSQLNLSGDTDKTLLNATLNNAGTVTWTGKGHLVFTSSTLNNSGLFDCQSDSLLVGWVADPQVFNNTGTFRKSAGDGATQFTNGCQLTNSGIVETDTGSILFPGYTHTFSKGTQFTGKGLTQFSGASIAVSGPLSVQGNLEMSGGVLTGAWELDGHMVWSGGTLQGQLTVPQGSQLNLSGDTDKTLLNATLNNAGTVTWTGQGHLVFTSSTLNNSGLFDCQSDSLLVGWVADPQVFNNTGTFRKSAGDGATQFTNGCKLTNSGIVETDSGSLTLANGVHTLAQGTRLTGKGPVRITGSQVTLIGDIPTEAGVELAGGELDGAGSFVGTLTWSGGFVKAQLTVHKGSQLQITGDDTKDLIGGHLILDGDTTWSGKGQLTYQDGAVIDQNGTLTPQTPYVIGQGGGADSTFNNNGTLLGPGSINGDHVVNYGTIRVDSAANIVTIYKAFTQAPSGTLVLGVQSADPKTGYGQLVVNGTAHLNGTLRLELAKGLSLAPKDVLSPIQFGAQDGAISSIQGVTLPTDETLEPLYGFSDLSLHVVTVPLGSTGPWLQLQGRSVVRYGVPASDFIYYGNGSDKDIYDVLMFIHVPRGMDVSLTGPAIPQAKLPAGDPFNTVAIDTGTEQFIPIYIYKLPAHFAGSYRLALTPRTQHAHEIVDVSADLLTAPESDFSRTGLGQSLWIDLLAQELAVVYRNPTEVPTLPAPSVVDLLKPVALSFAEAVPPAIPAGERGRRTGAAGPSELKQVPPDPSDPGTDPAGFFNQQMHNGNIQGIFDTGPIPAPYAYAGGIVLTIFAGAALVAGAPGLAISLGVAGGLFSIWGIISTGQSLETINSQKHQQVVVPGDPNEKSGPPGVGTGSFVTGLGGLSYDVIFENVPTASASAQRVTVTDPLDAAHLDLSTFALGPITFGGQLVTPPPAVQQFASDVDLRPAKDLLLHIEAALDPSRGVATWRFTSLDPATGKLTTDPELGFLDADKNPPQGEGSVSFSVAPRPGLATGTQITNQASVVFDVNAAIATNTWSNTLDSTRPTSQVQSLPAVAPGTSFDVAWSGTDLGSGVQDYTIYVSDNGGPFSPWLNHVAATKATALGQPGHTYAFYSLARDSVNNVEGKAPTAEATTFIPGSATLLGDVNADGKVDIRDVVALLRMVVGFTTPTLDQVKAGDLDQSGRLDIGDVVKLLRRVVGLA